MEIEGRLREAVQWGDDTRLETMDKTREESFRGSGNLGKGHSGSS